jgi:prepilin-type N-terminal cleavage/methylation domain-containing protein
MKRAGFTMIELIFVIVILGILSAVALPKFIGVSEQAKAGKCKAMVGTLNRTVLPGLWSNMVLNDENESTAFTATTIGDQINIPTECGAVASYVSAIVSGTPFTVHVGDNDYNVSRTIAPSTSEAPILDWGKQ